MIEALLPSIGALVFIDSVALTKDAKHLSNAHAFLVFYLRSENAAQMTNEMNYNTINEACVDKVKSEIACNKLIIVEAGNFSKMIPPKSLTNRALTIMIDVFKIRRRGK